MPAARPRRVRLTTGKRKPVDQPFLPCWTRERDAVLDAFGYARDTGTACAVVRVPSGLYRGLYQARLLPLPNSARVVAIINAKKAK